MREIELFYCFNSGLKVFLLQFAKVDSNILSNLITMELKNDMIFYYHQVTRIIKSITVVFLAFNEDALSRECRYIVEFKPPFLFQTNSRLLPCRRCNWKKNVYLYKTKTFLKFPHMAKKLTFFKILIRCKKSSKNYRSYVC